MNRLNQTKTNAHTRSPLARLFRARLFIAFLLAIALCAASAGAVFSVNPSPTTDLAGISLSPGQTAQGEMILHNKTGATDTFSLYTVDGIRNPQGIISTGNIAETQTLAGSWIIFKRDRFTINNNETAKAQFEINMPQSVTPGVYQGFIVMTQTNIKEVTGAGYATRVAYPYKITVPGEKKIDFTFDDFNYNEKTGVLSYKVQNKGNISVRTETEIVVRDLFENDFFVENAKDYELFTNDAVQQKHFLKLPLFGDYTVTLKMDYSENDLVNRKTVLIDTIERAVEVQRPLTPLIVSAAAALLFFIFAGVFIAKKSRLKNLKK